MRKLPLLFSKIKRKKEKERKKKEKSRTYASGSDTFFSCKLIMSLKTANLCSEYVSMS